MPDEGNLLVPNTASYDFAHMKDDEAGQKLMLWCAQLATKNICLGWCLFSTESLLTWEFGIKFFVKACPRLARGDLVTFTDRFTSGRKLLRGLLNCLPAPCQPHFERNAAAHCKADFDRGLFSRLFLAANPEEFDCAVEECKKNCPKMLEYILASELEQNIYSQQELDGRPYLAHIFSKYARLADSKDYALAAVDGRGGKQFGYPVRMSSNVVEHTNGSDSKSGIRSLALRDLINRKASEAHGIAAKVVAELKKAQSKSCLIPDAKTAFENAKIEMQAVSFLRDLGNGIYELRVPKLGVSSTVDLKKRVCHFASCESFAHDWFAVWPLSQDM